MWWQPGWQAAPQHTLGFLSSSLVGVSPHGAVWGGCGDTGGGVSGTVVALAPVLGTPGVCMLGDSMKPGMERVQQ